MRVSGWMRDYLAHDPKPDLAAIRVHLLAITGAVVRLSVPQAGHWIARVSDLFMTKVL
jgi:hypothetical protein